MEATQHLGQERRKQVALRLAPPQSADDQLFAAGNLHLDVQIGAIAKRREYIFQTGQRLAATRAETIKRATQRLCGRPTDALWQSTSRSSRVMRTSNSNPSQPCASAYSKQAIVFSGGILAARALNLKRESGRAPRCPSNSGLDFAGSELDDVLCRRHEHRSLYHSRVHRDASLRRSCGPLASS